ncbi:KAP115 [Symbiodinium natans]|uniref:KAP115 protein n=1 Tax=Symbiodinium natans TaxID=878477 RepID=A0A812JSC6_9DINO|nr:KAP115 [Symbiodinium natans]
MEKKVIGVKHILRVCTEPTNLEILAEHENLLQVLSRELRENSKKSSDLCVVSVCVFLCFSHFSQFHPVLMQNQCGDVTMRVLEYESQRAQVRKEDMERRQKRVQELEDCTAEDKKLLAKDEKKYKLQLRKQNKLMHISLSVLLNLAEEISIEKKMVNRKMPTLLLQLLDRSQEDLLLVVLTFLKKLSVFEENKDQIAVPQTLNNLVRLAQNPNARISLLALRLLFNLSFDERVRAALVESGIIKLLVDLLKNPPFRHIVLRLLYHFSMDDRCKSLMAYHRDGMIMLLQLVVHFPEPRVGKDLVALMVNLAAHARAAEVIVQSGLFPAIVLRVLKHRDPLLCKVIRHVASHQGVLEQMYELLQSEDVRMAKWMHEFVRMAVCSVDNPDMLVEVLGTLANVTLEEVPWAELCEAGLLELLTRLLVPSFSEDDVVLECVLLASNLACCPESAQHIAGSRLPALMQDLLVEKREDEEIVVQLLFTFHCLLLHDEVREFVLQETELAPCIMRFARARNPAVLEYATALLQIVATTNDAPGTEDGTPAWVEQIKAFRFEQHNPEWCRCVNRELSGGTGMSPGGAYGGYYDEHEGSGVEDEEEFAFHWAGVDAADPRDLAKRDWANQDFAKLSHSSRWQT